MSVISIETAMQHLYADPEDLPLVQIQLDAAEEASMQFLNRRFFVDQAALDSAKAGATLRTREARGVYASALVEADLPENADIRCMLRDNAKKALTETYETIDMDERGMVINAAITAACLLKLGHLFANREEVVTGITATELPLSSKSLLMPYRIKMGV
jgi:hypothetical protein